jgi:hypothetical protein
MNKDTKHSLKWAISLSIPISILGTSLGFALAHSEGFITLLSSILFAPFLLFIYIFDGVLSIQAPDWVLVIFGLSSQFLGYFLAITLFKKIKRKFK